MHQLKMQMGAGAASGITGVSHDAALFDLLAGDDIQSVQMQVAAFPSLRVAYHHVIASDGMVLRFNDDPFFCGKHRCKRWGGKIGSLMLGKASQKRMPAHAECRSDP